ncbi:hypothetical protein ABTN09_21310, partial [Acinetobacter baumannii]
LAFSCQAQFKKKKNEIIIILWCFSNDTFLNHFLKSFLGKNIKYCIFSLSPIFGKIKKKVK